jgi:hypothetical protein
LLTTLVVVVQQDSHLRQVPTKNTLVVLAVEELAQMTLLAQFQMEQLTLVVAVVPLVQVALEQLLLDTRLRWLHNAKY